MKFTYETQGAITYLVCELEATEQIDNLTLGMLTNNHIAGLAPVLYTEMNGQQFLKYNISAKVSSEQFFSSSMNKQRTLTAFHNILEAICSVDEYMIDQNCFSMLPEHIFLNVSNCEVALICVPAVTDKDITPEIASFFKKIMFSTQFDPNEDAGYITQLITYINSNANFNVYGLKDLVNNLQAGASVPQAAPVQPQAFNVPPVQQKPPVAAPISSFDSTISIDDMPAMLAAKQVSQNVGQQTPVQPHVVQKPNIPPVAPVQPVQQVQPPVQQPKAVVPPINKQINNPAPAVKLQPAIPQAPVIPKPPVQNDPGFAIPGQPAAKVQTPPIPAKPAQSTVTPTQPKAKGDKKMSFFGLLANYSKENAELYKKQKEEEKQSRAASSKPVQKPVQPVVPSGGQPVAKPVTPVTPVGQQFTPPQPQYIPPVQPVPVQNSFNETTVLSPSMMAGGETTVLGATGPNPRLTRIKTGEDISINKPVFRIGKEKSYVDYFIGDNTAISRSHANIHTDNGEYFIEDTNSTNHTYINGTLINSNVKTKLKNGDKVRLANEDFTFSV